jgi:hypothetical protein
VALRRLEAKGGIAPSWELSEKGKRVPGSIALRRLDANSSRPSVRSGRLLPREALVLNSIH